MMINPVCEAMGHVRVVVVHTMSRGFEMCVLDVTNTRSFISSGYEFSPRSTESVHGLPGPPLPLFNDEPR